MCRMILNILNICHGFVLFGWVRFGFISLLWFGLGLNWFGLVRFNLIWFGLGLDRFEFGLFWFDFG